MTPIFSLLSRTQRSALLYMHSVAEDGRVGKGQINVGEGYVTVTEATMRNLLGKGLATCPVGYPEHPVAIQITEAGHKECVRNGYKGRTEPEPVEPTFATTDAALMNEVYSVPEGDEAPLRLINILIEDATRRWQNAAEGSRERAYYHGRMSAYEDAANAFCGALPRPLDITEEAWMRASVRNNLDTIRNFPERLAKTLSL